MNALAEIETSLADMTAQLLGPTVLACIAYLASAAIRVLVRRRPRPRIRRRSTGTLTRLSLIGFATALSSVPTAAWAAHPLLRTQRDGGRPPWLGAPAAPPPRALLRAEAVDLPDSGPISSDTSAVHPAIHPSKAPGELPLAPLFPRADGPGRADLPSVSSLERAERLRSMARHPSGKGTVGTATRYTVVAGDTLWDIAARHLGTDDAARIARYWPRIHRANRDVVNPDPNLIRPGQRLHLPPE